MKTSPKKPDAIKNQKKPVQNVDQENLKKPDSSVTNSKELSSETPDKVNKSNFTSLPLPKVSLLLEKPTVNSNLGKIPQLPPSKLNLKLDKTTKSSNLGKTPQDIQSFVSSLATTNVENGASKPFSSKKRKSGLLFLYFKRF